MATDVPDDQAGRKCPLRRATGKSHNIALIRSEAIQSKDANFNSWLRRGDESFIVPKPTKCKEHIMTKFLTINAKSAQAKASRAGFGGKMLAGILVAGLMLPAFAGAASAAPFGIAPVQYGAAAPITKVEWRDHHNNGAVAGALIGLGILGIGAAAIAAQQQDQQQYYYAPAYQQPYYSPAPVYYGAPAYYGAPRYDGDHWRHAEYHRGNRDPYPNQRDQRFDH